MPTSDAVPSGDPGWSWRPPLADGESFILFPPLADRSRSARNGGGEGGREPKQLCRGPSLYTKSRAFPSMCAGGVRIEQPSTATRSSAEQRQTSGRPAQRRNLFDPRAQIYITARGGPSENPSSNSSEGLELAGKGQPDGNAQRRRLRSSGSTRRHAGTAKPSPARRLNSDLDAASFRRTAPSSRGRFRRRNADPTAAGGDD
jgi:hypothetical protein